MARLPRRLAVGSSQGRRTVARVARSRIAVPGADVIVSDSGVADVMVDRLEGLNLRMQDFEPVFDIYGRYIVEKHIPSQFARKGYPARWAPLSPAYAAWKARHFPGKPLLVRMGKMKAGFTWEARKQSLRIINRVKAGQRGGVPRWIYHQDGTDRMPARRMVQIGAKERAKLREIARQHLFVAGGIE